MTDTRDIDGFDPYDAMTSEAARLDAFFNGLSDERWAKPSRAEGWSVRDMLAHLTSSEDYNRACLDGTVSEFLAAMGAKGATDLASANEIGIRELDDVPTPELLDRWRERSAATCRDLRARDGGDIDTSVGKYPAHWQGCHLAAELAIHADDIAVPVTAAEADDRTAWMARVLRFMVREAKPDAEVSTDDGTTRVQAGDVDVELSDAVFVQAAAGRLPADSAVDGDAAAYLAVT